MAETLTEMLQRLKNGKPENLTGSEKPEWLAENEGRIRQQYGEKCLHYTWDILHAEKEIAECNGCNGLPCQKKQNKGFIPRIKIGENPYPVDIRYCRCKR